MTDSIDRLIASLETADEAAQAARVRAVIGILAEREILTQGQAERLAALAELLARDYPPETLAGVAHALLPATNDSWPWKLYLEQRVAKGGSIEKAPYVRIGADEWAHWWDARLYKTMMERHEGAARLPAPAMCIAILKCLKTLSSDSQAS